MGTLARPRALDRDRNAECPARLCEREDIVGPGALAG
jgi:hypothetical protein